MEEPPATTEPTGARRHTILILTDFYLPGFRAGGPVRSIENAAEALSSTFDFKIACRDRDLGSRERYPGIRDGDWQPVGPASVRYLSEREAGWGIREFLRSTPHDVMYLNSFFSPRFTVLPLLLRLTRAVPGRPVVVAPRGEFDPGALRLKSAKKRMWVVLSRVLGLYRNVLWQASSEDEARRVRSVMGTHARVLVAPDIISPPNDDSRLIEIAEKERGMARLVFISRITPKKNLEFAIRAISGVSAGHVEFDIYGPIEDGRYWKTCADILTRTRNPRVVTRYMGEIPPSAVLATLSSYHLFVFPTKGENFGHVIYESLAAGCPVAVSDQTPWGEIAPAGAGWVLPLASPDGWKSAVASIIEADEARMHEMRVAARGLAVRRGVRSDDVERTRRLFLTASTERGKG
jgi:glycosyltransferase involved in cell wall biosynthesis